MDEDESSDMKRSEDGYKCVCPRGQKQESEGQVLEKASFVIKQPGNILELDTETPPISPPKPPYCLT